MYEISPLGVECTLGCEINCLRGRERQIQDNLSTSERHLARYDFGIALRPSLNFSRATF